MADYVLVGGTVVDGTGGQPFPATVAIQNGRISELGQPGRQVPVGPQLDVTGLVIAPGFIDMHAHSDLAVINDPLHTAKVWQGVTLEVVGQDGLSYAPVTDNTLERLVVQLAAWNGTPEHEPAWRTVGEYLSKVDEGSPVNVAYLVPHGSVRLAVLGAEDRPAGEGELAQMTELVREGLEQGAMGLSAGLTYTPAMYADDDELVALCAPVRAAGGYYCPHHRNYGAQVVEGYADCIKIARQAGVALHLAHCHVSYRQNAGRAHEVLELIDAARANAELDVTLDSYPYVVSATYLASVLPSWSTAGGPEQTRVRLSDPNERRRVLYDLEVKGSHGNHGIPIDWSIISISGVSDANLEWAVGKSIAELSREQQRPAGDVFFDLLGSDPFGVGCLFHAGNEDNVRTIMRHPVHMAGSDGLLFGAKPHPRAWGTFARYLGTYVRELELFTLEECVAHLTSRPARRLGLRDRGVIRVGAAADLVAFDPMTVDATATYENPRSQPIGIEHVLVNGEFTLRDRRRTDRLPGRAVRRGAEAARQTL